MYELLTAAELTALQSMLYEGAEEAYWNAEIERGDPECGEHYRPLHTEIAHLFIEAGTELLERLDRQLAAA